MEPHPASPSIQFRFLEVNNIKIRIAEEGSGPLVLLVHGWPETWFSWRYQIPFLAQHGYHAVAPDMRGYGYSDSPQAVEDFDINHICNDLLGIMDCLGVSQAYLVGHDWGAIITWMAAQMYPSKFPAIVALSVPYGGRQHTRPTDAWRKRFEDNFFYILYHQIPDKAENEYDSKPAEMLLKLYSEMRMKSSVSPKMSAGGMLHRMDFPQEFPKWLSKQDFEYFVTQFEHSGFRGGVNYYRNFDRNWEITSELAGKPVEQPCAFIGGKRDMVLGMFGGEKHAELATKKTAKNLRKWVILENVGHWIQQEAPEQVNNILLEFLNSLQTGGERPECRVAKL